MTPDPGFMRFTTAALPISRAVMLESGIHVSLLLKPFFVLPEFGSNAELPRIDEIGRCRGCNAYMNAYTTFEERGYVCTFCYCENTFDQQRNARYIGPATRTTLPELQGVFYDVLMEDLRNEDHHKDQDDQTIGVDGHGDDEPRRDVVRPVYLAIVDVCGGRDAVEEFRSALLTALDELSENQYFSLVLLDESSMYVMNWKANRFHTISCKDHNALQTMTERMMLKDVLGRVGSIKKDAALLVSQLEPKPVKKGEEHLHSCYFGEAIRSLLSFLLKGNRADVPYLDLNGRFLGSRIAAFLSKVPSKGSGQVMSQDQRPAERDTGYYQDPLNPEFVMANLSIRESRGEESSAAVDNVPIRESNAPAHARAGILDTVAQEFYSGAGAAAAVTGLAIDVYLVGKESDAIGAENLAIMTSLSGGHFAVYDGEDVSLAEDLHDAMRLDEFLECSIKIRTSPELEVLGNMDSRMQEDCEQNNLYHIPRLSCNGTCGGILFDLRDAGLGLSNRLPIYVQAAIRYHRIDDDGILHRYLRVITYEFPLAKTVGEVLSSHNSDVHLYVEFTGALSLMGLSGRDEAASVLDDRLEQYEAKRQAWIEEGDYLEDSGESRQLGPDVFGVGMHRLIGILDGGGAAGEFERLSRLYYANRRGTEELMALLSSC